MHTLPSREISGSAKLGKKKYARNHLGIDFTDLELLGCKKRMAQSILKRMCIQTYDRDGQKRSAVLFRSPIRTCPQKFFPASVKAEYNRRLEKEKTY